MEISKGVINLLFFCCFFLFIITMVTYADVSQRLKVLEKNIGAEPMPAVTALGKIASVEEKISKLQSDFSGLEFKNLSFEQSLNVLDSELNSYINLKDIYLDEIEIPYSSNSYAAFKTEFGTLIVFIESTRVERNGVELSICIFNPTLITFSNVETIVSVGDVRGAAFRDIVPRVNIIKVLLAPIKQEDIETIKIKLPLNVINFYK